MMMEVVHHIVVELLSDAHPHHFRGVDGDDVDASWNAVLFHHLLPIHHLLNSCVGSDVDHDCSCLGRWYHLIIRGLPGTVVRP